MPPLSGLGKLIRSERLRLGLDQGQLAAKAGIARTTLNRYENGKRLPAGEELEGILEAFGWDLRALAEKLEGPGKRHDAIEVPRLPSEDAVRDVVTLYPKAPTDLLLEAARFVDVQRAVAQRFNPTRARIDIYAWGDGQAFVAEPKANYGGASSRDDEERIARVAKEILDAAREEDAQQTLSGDSSSSQDSSGEGATGTTGSGRS